MDEVAKDPSKVVLSYFHVLPGLLQKITLCRIFYISLPEYTSKTLVCFYKLMLI